MAKQAVGPLERHVEKIVLGVCALVLFGAVGMYLVRSPNVIDIGGEQAGPGEVNQIVRNQAQAVMTRIRNAKPEVTLPESPLADLQQSTDLVAYADVERTLEVPVPSMPEVPNVGLTPVEGELALVEVVPPSQPIMQVGRSSADLLPAIAFGESAPEYAEDDFTFVDDVNWVTVAAVFDKQSQQRQAKLAGYDPGMCNPYLIGVDLQRRQRNPDGTWPEEWQDVVPYSPELPPIPPEIELDEVNSIPFVKDEIRAELADYFQVVQDYQLEIMRPLFPQVIHGTAWKYPKFPDINVAALDDEFLNPEGDGQPPYEDRYGIVEEAPAAEKEATKSPRELQLEVMAKIKALKEKDTEESLQEALDLTQAELKNPQLLATNKKLLEALDSEIQQLIRDWARKHRETPPEEEEDKEIVRTLSPVQVVWVHDAERGSVKSGATYQYRMRHLLYNRYAGVPKPLKNKEDALKVFTVSDWSPPSEAVTIPNDTRFFLAGDKGPGADAVTIHMFKWFEGNWVEKKVDVAIGERIGGIHRVPVRLPDGGIDRPEVNFDTGAQIVDIRYNQSVRLPHSKGKDGVAFGEPQETVMLVFADDAGYLHERLLEIEKASEEYKEMKDSIERPKPIVKKPPKNPPGGGGLGGGGRGGTGGGRGGGGKGGGGKGGGGKGGGMGGGGRGPG